MPGPLARERSGALAAARASPAERAWASCVDLARAAASAAFSVATWVLSCPTCAACSAALACTAFFAAAASAVALVTAASASEARLSSTDATTLAAFSRSTVSSCRCASTLIVPIASIMLSGESADSTAPKPRPSPSPR